MCTRRPCRWAPRRITWYELAVRGLLLLVRYTPFRGFAPRSLRRAAASYFDTLHNWPQVEYRVKKVTVGAASGETQASHLAAVETNILHKLPSLVAHCCIVKYEDGTPRRPGWWTVKTMGAAWCVQVKDPDGCAQLQATAQSLDDALALADLLLSSEQAPWEHDPWLAQQSKKGKK